MQDKSLFETINL